MSELNEEQRSRAARLERKKKRQRQARIRMIAIIAVFAILIGVIVFLCVKLFGQGGGSTDTQAVVTTEQGEETGDATEAPTSAAQDIIDEAALLFAQYDYDGAIAMLQTIPDYQSDEAVTKLISDYQLAKDTAVTVDVTTVPHVFFHTLICDFDRCFNSGNNQSLVNGYNAWMVTCDEFSKCISQLYDLGYVIINISDCYDKDADGNYTVATDIKLPADKKAIIFSYDDTCYYCAYEGFGMADRLVLDENGDIKNEYTDASGNTTTGNYDHIPILIDFCREHPDFAWHGHKGTLALTGYNGVFGYRTEIRTFTNPDNDESAWLSRHTWCQQSEIETYKAQATEIANALKENGYEFASHTWGHRHCDQKDLSWLETDTSWWLERVGCIVGETDIFVYPHGSDIAGMEDYTMDNEKYAYLKSVGFGVFCGVDGTALYWNQYRSDYIRQSRINIDGICMYQTLQGSNTALTKLGLDVEAIFDTRRPTPITAS